MKPACCFPHRPLDPRNRSFELSISDWKRSFPFSLGFVKFTLEVQKAILPDSWPIIRFKTIGTPNSERVVEDRTIWIPVMKKYGLPHIHDRYILHNHSAPSLRSRFKSFLSR